MTNVFRFPDRSAGFNPTRLIEARLALQLSRAELARDLEMSGQAIGFYEAGERRPDMATLLRIAERLQQPVSFFLKPAPTAAHQPGTRFFRSVGSKSNKINHALDVRAKWLWELVGSISEEVRLPSHGLPDVNPPESSQGYSLEEIEAVATAVRRGWLLGDGPITNVIALLETHGLIVSRFELGSDKIDAFSSWIGKRPYIFLGSDKQSCCRSRFDAAHELGHLLLHRDVGQEDIENPNVRHRIEREANLFAGAFLLPRPSMLREFYSTRLSHLEGMKMRWRVSMQAIAHRAKEMELIDEYQYVLFRKQISARNYNKNEPGDSSMALEQPQWLLKCWNAFAQKRGIVSAGVEDELGFTLDKVMALFGRTDIPKAAFGPGVAVVLNKNA
jgi:Zn-dependent peptidase ImmA (M78 family)/DNA-binding XRE family transcriptional regulator